MSSPGRGALPKDPPEQLCSHKPKRFWAATVFISVQFLISCFLKKKINFLWGEAAARRLLPSLKNSCSVYLKKRGRKFLPHQPKNTTSLQQLQTNPLSQYPGMSAHAHLPFVPCSYLINVVNLISSHIQWHPFGLLQQHRSNPLSALYWSSSSS